MQLYDSDSLAVNTTNIQQGFLKRFDGVQTQTTNLHVLTKFGRFPLQLSWQALAGKYMDRLESIDADRLLKQTFDADCRLPATKSWRSCYEDQLHNHLVSSRTEDMPHRRQFSLPSAQFQHIQQLSQQTSSKGQMYSHIKLGYASEPYIQQTNTRHLWKIIAQFRTGSHWLHIETGRHKKLEEEDRTCSMCAFMIKLRNPGLPAELYGAFDSDDGSDEPVENEHHASFDCPGYRTSTLGLPRGAFTKSPMHCARIAEPQKSYCTLLRTALLDSKAYILSGATLNEGKAISEITMPQALRGLASG